MSSALDTPTDHRSALASVIDEIIAPDAAEIDRTGAYPRAALDALGAAGLLGLLSSPDVGGGGGSVADVAEVVEKIAAACGSTAMVVLMHYAAVAVLEPHGPAEVRAAIARGEHISSLAFSEAGSRSHFWAPVSTATTPASRALRTRESGSEYARVGPPAARGGFDACESPGPGSGGVAGSPLAHEGYRRVVDT